MKYYLFEIHVTVSVPCALYHYYFDVPKAYADDALLEDIKNDIENVTADYIEMCLDQCPCINIEGASAAVVKKNITDKQYFNMIKG